MIKYAIHVSDIQVRKMARHEEFKKVFDLFFDMMKENINSNNSHEYIFVVTGDIFHNKIDISNEQQTLIKSFFERLSDITTTVVVAGNHDLLVNNKQRMDSLTPVIESLKKDNIHYFKESKVYEIENLAFVNYSVFEDNNKPGDLEDFKEMNKNKKLTYVGLYHSQIEGSINHNNMVFDKGDSVSIFDGCDLVMAGDIHKYQVVKSNIPVVYAGSMLQQNVGESLSNHGFVIWDLNKKTHKIVELHNDHTMVKLELVGINNLKGGLKIKNE